MGCREACRRLWLCGAVRKSVLVVCLGAFPSVRGAAWLGATFLWEFVVWWVWTVCKDILPREGQKKLQLGFLLLRRHLFLFRLEGLQIVGVRPCPPRRALVVMVGEVSLRDETQVFPFTACGGSFFAVLGITGSQRWSSSILQFLR